MAHDQTLVEAYKIEDFLAKIGGIERWAARYRRVGYEHFLDGNVTFIHPLSAPDRFWMCRKKHDFGDDQLVSIISLNFKSQF